MDATGKLAPGIVGIVVCLILVMAVALPVMNSMIATIADEESVPGPVTATGTNAADMDDAYALLEPSSTAYNWVFTGITDSDDVALVYEINKQQKERIVNPSGFRLLVSSDGRTPGVVISLEGTDLKVYYSGLVNVFTIPTNDSAYIDIAFKKVSGDPQLQIYRWFSAQDQEWVTFTDVNWVFSKTYVTGGGTWTLEPTHGFMSGNPGSFLGDGSAFHFDTYGSRALAVDVTPAIGLDQRVFMLDNGRILDLDDLENPIKESVSLTKASSGEVGGPVLKATVTGASSAVEFSSSSATEVLSGTASGYVGTWTEVAFEGGLDVPRLDSVESGGSAVSGWYVPLEWEYTGMGIVDREPIAKTVLSIVPLVLVVALFILVVRWMQAGVGRAETDAFLGSRRRYDGWRDRR